MNQKELFAEHLRTAMEQKQMKQVDLVHAADQAGLKVGKSHISQYVSGKTLPRADIAHFLADTLEVEEEWLLGDASKEDFFEPEIDRSSLTDNKKPPVRHFSKSSKLDNVLYDVRGPVVDEANRMERDGTNILKLNIGNPAPFGFRTPDEVIYDMRNQLTDCEGYSPSQ